MIVRDVIVVGAGLAGLGAAIAARRAGFDCTVLEKGALVDTVFRAPADMVCPLASDHLELGGVPFPSHHERPTRAEALCYYRRVTDAFELDVQLEDEVTRVFEDVDGEAQRVLSLETRSSRGVRRVQHARFVVLATGASAQPARLGVPGEDFPHVSHRYAEAHGYYRKRVVVVGGGIGAAEAALDLARSGARVTLVHRGAQLEPWLPDSVAPRLARRLQEGAIAARLGTSIAEVRPTTILVEGRDGQEEIPADAVLVLNGRQPDASFFERAGIEYEPDSLVPRYHPQSFESSVPGLFVAGTVLFGREAERAAHEGIRLHGEQIIRTVAARLQVPRLAPR
jgi:thioredoxin reductase (NADPH)